MKISYIILPFNSSEYLVRCINSIYRQHKINFEIILAENLIDSEKYGESAENIKKISQRARSFGEKIREAVSLISDESNYFIFIDVKTVISPAIEDYILGEDNSDVIIPLVASKSEGRFIADKIDIQELLFNIEKYSPERYCFAAKFKSKFQSKFFENNYIFSNFIYGLFLENAKVSLVNEICLYTENKLDKIEIDSSFESVKKRVVDISNKIENTLDTTVKLIICKKILLDLMHFWNNKSVISREVFCAIQLLGEKVKNSASVKKVFEEKIGCRLEVFLAMNNEEYQIWCTPQNPANCKAMDVEHTDTKRQEQLLQDMQLKIIKLQKSLDDIAQNQKVFAKNYNEKIRDCSEKPQTTMENPVVEVPQLYAEGKLGFKVIWRSFCNWLSFKISDKHGR